VAIWAAIWGGGPGRVSDAGGGLTNPDPRFRIGYAQAWMGQGPGGKGLWRLGGGVYVRGPWVGGHHHRRMKPRRLFGSVLLTDLELQQVTVV
jgi:hypothetical protein